MEADKHIFMEKPCCVDAPGYRKLIAANNIAREKQLSVVVGLQRHHQQSYIDGIQQIHDGAIGDIVAIQTTYNCGPPWFRNKERLPDWTEMEYQMRNWYYFNWLCGDHILEQHIHNIDVANWFLGELPASAQGMGGRQVRKFGPDGDYGQIYDHHTVEFTYGDGTKMFSQCRHMKDTYYQVTEAFQGTNG